MEQYNHFTYGQQLVNGLKLFLPHKEKSYHQAPNSDSLASISHRLSSINHPVLVAIDGRDSDFDDNGAEALLQTSQYFFMLLKPAASDNPQAVLDAQGVCEANALQIQARLMQDALTYRNGLTDLLTDSFSIRSIGPIGDNLYGVIMGFNVRRGTVYTINNAYWNV